MRFIYVILAIVQPFALSQYCDISYCNNRGICKESNKGSKVCECVDEYFSGPKCEQVVDKCLSRKTPCQATFKCTPKPGEYFCPQCTNGMYGKSCKLKLEAPSNLAVFHPYIMEYGKSGRFFIAVETRPQKNSSWPWRFFTPTDLLSFIPSDDLRYSSDLSKTMDEYKIYKSYDLPYNSGYYAVHDITFWETGKVKMRFELDDTSGWLEKHFYFLRVYDKDPTCKTKFLTIFKNQRETVQVDAVNIIRPKKIESCGRVHSSFKFTYYLLSYNGEKVLHHFKDQSEPFLKIPPYFFSGFKAKWVQIRADIEERFDDKVLYSRCSVSIIFLLYFSNCFGFLGWAVRCPNMQSCKS